jgi:hypothetical protein
VTPSLTRLFAPREPTTGRGSPRRCPSRRTRPSRTRTSRKARREVGPTSKPYQPKHQHRRYQRATLRLLPTRHHVDYITAAVRARSCRYHRRRRPPTSPVSSDGTRPRAGSSRTIMGLLRRVVHGALRAVSGSIGRVEPCSDDVEFGGRGPGRLSGLSGWRDNVSRCVGCQRRSGAPMRCSRA